MRTELIGVKLPLHDAVLVRRAAAEVGLSKSAFAANLIVRGLEARSADQLPALLDHLREAIAEFKELTNRISQLDGARSSAAAKSNNDELRAFMIEVLVLLRYLTKNDLRLGGEIGRKLERAVGNVRVQGT